MRSAGIFARQMTHCLATAIMVAGVGLAACSDESPSEPQASAPAPTEEETPSFQLEWLRLTDGIAPEQWLASREAGRSLDVADPAVADMRRVLDVAAARFRDHPRMIANRAVQLETMLKEKRIDERAPRIIANLSQIPGQTRYVESFAALTQQYYNLRMEGFGRSEAIDRLRQQNALAP
jgi:hypothetical protein